MRASGRGILKVAFLLAVVLLLGLPTPGQGAEPNDVGAIIQTSRYVFQTEESVLLQTGGFAGVNWTYAMEGQFCLDVDPNSGFASFRLVDAKAVDTSEPARTLNLNQVFNLTGLTGAALNEATIEFTGQIDDGSSVLLTLAFDDNLAHLTGATIPPPNSADFFVFTLDAVAARKYAGGTGEPNDPYRIATATELIALGDTPGDYDKQFILTADIDLSGFVFDRALIAPDMNDAPPFQGRPFAGTLDGNGHVISNLRLVANANCDNYLGLFGRLEGTVRDLGLSNALIQGQPGGTSLGTMVGACDGTIERCYARGSILGYSGVGGLVGWMGGGALVVDCYAHVEVGVFEGRSHAGGLVATNGGVIRTSYSTGTVGGVPAGLRPSGLVTVSYGPVVLSFWDMESSGVTVSYGGFGRTTTEMMTASTFAGWSGDVWELTEGDYPRLVWERTGGTPLANEMERCYAGTGTEEDPFLLADANDLYTLACRPDDWQGHIELVRDIDMLPIPWYPTIADFRGVLNGNGHVIANLKIHENTSMLGLVGFMPPGAVIDGVQLDNFSISGYSRLGGLVGFAEGGWITDYACEGALDGVFKLGGLVGHLESASVARCRTDVRIWASEKGELIGGLAGYARGHAAGGEYSIRDCYAVGTLTLGDQAMWCGGLAGAVSNVSVSNCYAVSRFSLGENWKSVGGLVGEELTSTIDSSYWDTDVSDLTGSAGGAGLTTAEMQTAATFLDAGWDFVGEAENGTEDIWWIDEGRDYPRLWWERDGGPSL